MIQNLKNKFNNSLIVIDEIHNIRMTNDNQRKVIAEYLLRLVKSADNLRLLLLSATPMFNSYKEIIWLLNLMNINDRRAIVETKDIFDADGNFKVGKNEEQIGKELLIRKATGYVSYVRGENPYTFPFRVYPVVFSPEDTFKHYAYPDIQMNGKKIEDSNKIKIFDLYLSKIGSYQSVGYNYILNSLNKEIKKDNLSTFENLESFGYAILQTPIQALNIIYPSPLLETTGEISQEEDQSKVKDAFIKVNELSGKNGLDRLMKSVDSKNPPEKGFFEYKESTLQKYGKIFSFDEIGKYSSKIKIICENILKSEGVILVYSQYIDGGLIPIALALEELGFIRYSESERSLFKTPPSPLLDAETMKRRENKKGPIAKYSLITGDSRLSPNNDFEVKAITNEDNKNGYHIKVVLISSAGSEGLDFKFLRQVHILEPWYNINRIEQIIGRAVRNFSHKDLPFEKRNVQIFMHATILNNQNEESADLYIYRAAEYKAIQIGRVTRILKETAVDCILNHDQTNFTQENFKEILERKIKQKLSNGTVISDFKVGDAAYSSTCDYMANCSYKCYPDKDKDGITIREDTYDEGYIFMNSEKILQKIKNLMKDKFFYKKKELFDLLNYPKPYPKSQIYAALTQLIEDDNEYIYDKYGRSGYLVNNGDYYLFQPNELNNEKISLFDRSKPIDFKNSKIVLDIKYKNKNGVKEIEEEDEMCKLKIKETLRFIKNVFNEEKNNYDLIFDFVNSSKIPTRGDENWYKHCGITIRKLIKNGDIDLSESKIIVTDHILDFLLYDDKVEILKYLFEKNDEFDEFGQLLKEAYNKRIIKLDDLTALVFYCGTEQKIWKFNIDLNKWSLASPLEIISVNEYLNTNWKIDNKKLNMWLGFVGYDNKSKYYVFKTRNMEATRDTGSRCDQAKKERKIEILNNILGKDFYNKENTKGMGKEELCSLQEILFRKYNDDRKSGKIWFLNSEVSIFNKF
jgi:hypothetical protein